MNLTIDLQKQRRGRGTGSRVWTPLTQCKRWSKVDIKIRRWEEVAAARRYGSGEIGGSLDARFSRPMGHGHAMAWRLELKLLEQVTTDSCGISSQWVDKILFYSTCSSLPSSDLNLILWYYAVYDDVFSSTLALVFTLTSLSLSLSLLRLEPGLS